MFVVTLLKISSIQFISVQSLSHVRLFATPWITACQASLSITNSRNPLRLTSIESVMPSSLLILCHPLLLLPPIPPSIKDFSHESMIRGPHAASPWCDLGLIGILCRAAGTEQSSNLNSLFTLGIFKKEIFGDTVQPNVKILGCF